MSAQAIPRIRRLALGVLVLAALPLVTPPLVVRLVDLLVGLRAALRRAEPLIRHDLNLLSGR